MINCNEKKAAEFLSWKVNADETELILAQNLLEFMAPYGYMFDVQWIIREIAANDESAEKFFRGIGFDLLKGKLKVTKDPKLLDQLDQSKLTTPGIIKHDVRVWDKLKVKELDKITIDHNIFLEYHGGKSEDKTVIIPVHIQLNFLGGFRKGIGSKNGHSQEFASEWLNPFLIEMQACQTVDGKNEIVDSDTTIEMICSELVRNSLNHFSY